MVEVLKNLSKTRRLTIKNPEETPPYYDKRVYHKR